MSCTRYFQPRLKARLMRGEEPGWLQRHCRRKYIIQAVLSHPDWVERAALYALRDEARRMGGTIDHIVPLNHPYVCGLSVPWNMRVIRGSSNFSKGNRWCQWHGELFTQPEQLTLLFTGASP